MAKKPEPDLNAVLCTTCDKQVVKNEKKEWVHANSRVTSHEVLKTIKYSDWAAKYNADRTIKNKEGVAVRGPGIKRPSTAPKAAAKPAVKKKTQAERAAIRAENDAARAKVIAERQERQDNMEEAWDPKLGHHVPLVTSVKPVVRPSTGEIFIPSTGRVVGQMDPSGIPPKLGSPERDKLNESINHVHEDHPWVPVYSEDGTLARSPKMTVTQAPGGVKGVSYSGKRRYDPRQYLGGMKNWAARLKAKQDPNDEKEFKVWRATPVENGDYRGLPYNASHISQLRDIWSISSRDKYCEKCAPTVTLPNGSIKPNPVKSVDRPPLETLDVNTGVGDTTMREVMTIAQARAGGGTGRTKQRKNWLEAFGIDQNKTTE
jgi:hypothetical protein